MKSNVFIIKLNTGWMLRITSYQDDVSVVSRYTFNKLVDAMNAANKLRVHIDNVEQLPINQYKKAA